MLLWNVPLSTWRCSTSEKIQQYLIKRHSIFCVTWEYLCTTTIQKIIIQRSYKINRHVLMCCVLANARWSSIQILIFHLLRPLGLGMWLPRWDSFWWDGCSCSATRCAEALSVENIKRQSSVRRSAHTGSNSAGTNCACLRSRDTRGACSYLREARSKGWNCTEVLHSFPV